LEFAGTVVLGKYLDIGPNKWESVAEVQYFCGELSFEYLYDLCKWNFWSNSHVVRVQPIDLFIKLNSHLLSSLKAKYDATGNSQSSRKRDVWLHFSKKFL